MRKWRFVTAIFLTGLFLALSFAAEFAHNHLGTQIPLALHADDCDYVNERTAVQKRTSICIACISFNTPLAVDHPSSLIRIDLDNQPYSSVVGIITSLDSHLPHDSRAPPYIFA